MQNLRVEMISKFKSVVLVFAMLTFAIISVFEGVAVGHEQNNVEEPVLEISKTMISGDTTVPIKTRVYWELEIDVTNNGDTDLSKVEVKDKLPKEIELLGTTASKGSVEMKGKKGVKLEWEIGTMAPGDTETLVMEIATAEKHDDEDDEEEEDSIEYHFSKPREYKLNKGATVVAKIGKTKVKAGPTDPIMVNAE